MSHPLLARLQGIIDGLQGRTRLSDGQEELLRLCETIEEVMRTSIGDDANYYEAYAMRGRLVQQFEVMGNH